MISWRRSQQNAAARVYRIGPGWRRISHTDSVAARDRYWCTVFREILSNRSDGISRLSNFSSFESSVNTLFRLGLPGSDFNRLKDYVFGGIGGAARSKRTTTIRYNLANHMASFVAPQNFYWVEELSTAVFNGKMYVFGGRGRTADDTEPKQRNFSLEYDPVADSWRDLEPRMDLKPDATPCVVYGDEIYLFGGADTNRNRAYTVHAYHPGTDTWREATTIPLPINNFIVAVVDTKAFLIGGRSVQGSELLWSMEVLSYDFETKTWQESGYTNLPEPGRAFSFCHAAPVINGRIYCIGGNTDQNLKEVTDRVDVYNPRTNRWSMEDSLPLATGSACIVQNGSSIYVAGGIIGEDIEDSIGTDKVYRLDVETTILELQKGWNLISLSKQPQDNGIENIFGDKIAGLVWTWNSISQNYEVASTITTSKGFWVYSKDDFLDNNAIQITLP